jgi:hypothetical protein
MALLSWNFVSMNDHVQNVRMQSAGVQVDKPNLVSSHSDNRKRGNKIMAFNNMASSKSGLRDSRGHQLVFAPPILNGFQASPLALSVNRKLDKTKSQSRRKWAKRRAYEA